jgi:hypothetical protein
MMYILLILFTALIIIIIGMLFIPLIICIDTDKECYEVRLKGLLQLRLISREDMPALRMHVPFYTKEFQLINNQKKQNIKHNENKNRNENGKKRSKSRMTPERFMALIRTFKIRQLYVSLDTGDYVNNALLVPLFQWITHYGNQLEVNFNDDTIIRFKASNNIWRLGTTYLRTASKN